MTFLDSTIDSVKSAFCTFVNATDKGTSFFNELNPLDDVPSYGPFWNRVLCNRNEPLPQPNSGFTGGQCAGVQYQGTYTRTTYGGLSACNASTSTSSWQGEGPITLVGPRPSPTIDPGPGQTFWECKLEYGDGGGQNVFGLTQDDSCPDPTFEMLSISRVDGQPDNCGNQPPPPFPPQGETVDIDITYVNNEGDSVTELGDLTIFAPVVVAPVTVLAPVKIIAPIRVDLPDVSFNGNIVLSPDFNVELSPPSFRRGPGSSDDAPPVDRPDSNPDTPEDDSPRQVVGAITTVTAGLDDGKATEVDGGSGPDLFVPRLGTIAFRVRSGINLSWSEAYDIKTTTQYHPAPLGVQSLDAIAAPNPGYSIAVTLVYREPDTP